MDLGLSLYDGRQKQRARRRVSLQDTPIYRAPFFNRDYLVAIKERDNERMKSRFVLETFRHYDADQKGSLTVPELSRLVKDLYSTLGLASPKDSFTVDWWAREFEGAATELERISGDSFETFLLVLLNRALFKVKLEPFTVSTAQSPVTAAMPSECADFSIGEKVMVMSFKKCYTMYRTGAKRLGLRRFEANQERFPPRSDLTVIGSIRMRGKCFGEEVIPCNSYIVAVADEDGEEYLVDSTGLQPSQQQMIDTPGNVRAKAEAVQLGVCLTVRNRLQEAKDDKRRFRKGTGW